MSVSEKSWAQGEINGSPIALDLVLPPGQIIHINGDDYLAYSLNEYKIILKIYTGYSLWATNYGLQKDLEAKFNVRLTLCEDKYRLELSSSKLLATDRNLAYTLLDKERKRNASSERALRIKIGLFTGGGAVVGIGLGILFGFLAAK